ATGNLAISLQPRVCASSALLPSFPHQPERGRGRDAPVARLRAGSVGEESPAAFRLRDGSGGGIGAVRRGLARHGRGGEREVAGAALSCLYAGATRPGRPRARPYSQQGAASRTGDTIRRTWAASERRVAHLLLLDERDQP